MARMCKALERDISIHALREEGDFSFRTALYGNTDFYPRPPRGGRLLRVDLFVFLFKFLSTPSARRATVFFQCFRCFCVISIHALREEGDFSASIIFS